MCTSQAELDALPTTIEHDQGLLSGAVRPSKDKLRKQSSSSSSSSGQPQLCGFFEAAVRARLEHKLLLREAVVLLQEYQQHLAA